MSAKIFIIDSLSRSGTTLLSSILHSQNNSVCYRGVFHELMACELKRFHDIGQWKRAYVFQRLLVDNDEVIVNKDKSTLEKLSKYFIGKKYFLSTNRLIESSLKTITRKDQTGEISLDEWKSFLYNFKLDSLEDIDLLYQELANKNNTKLLGFRWNQGLAFIKKFLRNPNHYWISIIRNPMDRALSDKKAFNVSINRGIQYTYHYGKKLEETKHLDKHHIIYYEDLIENPEKVILGIYEFLGTKIDDINYELIQQSGKQYKVESSDLVDKGGKHTDGESFKGFDKSKIGKSLQYLSESEKDGFKRIIDQFELYKPYRV